MANVFDQFDAPASGGVAAPSAAPRSSDAYSEAMSDMSALTQGGGSGNVFDQFDAKPPAQPATQYSTADSTIGGYVSNLTFDTADEMGAGIDYAVDHLLPGGKSRPYSVFLDKERAALGQAQEQHPVAFLGGQVAGALTGGVGLAKGGLSLGARAAQSGAGWMTRLLGGAIDGGAQAGLYGAGSAEGGARERAAAGFRAAPMGFALGGVAEGAALGIGAGINRTFRGPATAADRATAAANVQAADEFGIPLSRAQATRSVSQTAAEDQLRSQGRMQDFDARQVAAVDRAASDFQGTLAGRGDRVASPADAFGDAQAALRQRRDALKSQSIDAYGASADDPSVMVPAEAVDALPGFIRRRLAKENIVVDADLHKVAAGALKWVDNLVARVPRGADGTLRGVQAQLKWVEQMRSGLRKNFQPIAHDAPAIKEIRASVDGWLDAVFDHNLVSGSDEVLGELKRARATYSEWANTVKPSAKIGGRLNPTYAAQARVRDIMETAKSPDEIGRYLFGSSVAQPKAMSWSTARELKRQLGADSQAWNGIRQAFWLRATRASDETLHADKIAKNLTGFLSENRGLASELYSADELAAMRRFAGVVSGLRHVRPGINGSNTANRLMPMLLRHAQDVVGMLVGGAGYAAGFHPALSTGAGLATRAATGLGEALRQRSLTNTATMRPVPALPSGLGGTVNRGVLFPMERARREPLVIDVVPIRKAS